MTIIIIQKYHVLAQIKLVSKQNEYAPLMPYFIVINSFVSRCNNI